ncbi:T9SS type A sorting domain-containing protein [Flavobacterium sp.]|uniref:T9SS type A sorting domain-containing protein n=1 Tax=Flavobacterium sp. TaxID=239 RepID=UPI0039E651CD
MKKTTFQWKSLLATAVLFTATSLSLNAQCLTAEFGQYPGTTFTPAECDGTLVNMITDLGYASEYSVLTVTLGQTYVFSSSIETDFITISADDGVTSAASGVSPLTWVSTIEGEVRFYTHVSSACESSQTFRERNVVCGIASTDQPDYANLQYPVSESIMAGQLLTVYGQAWEPGLTDVEPGLSGQAAGLQMWVGLNNENNDPSTWTYWVPAVHNAGHISNNDEYMADIGNNVLPGTYYYATKWRLNNGPAVYGGITAGGDGGVWNGTVYLNGVLTVTAPTNDNFANPIAVSCDNNYSGLTAAATLDEDTAPDGGGADLDAPNLWYSFTGTGTPQTVTLSLCNSFYDTSVLVYTGSSGALSYVAANDDGCGDTTQSFVTFNSDGLSTYYITVEGWNVGSTGLFNMQVSCADVQEPAVANQTCALALGLLVDGTTTDSDNSFGDVTATQPPCDLFGSIQDVWFSFECPESGTVDCLVTPVNIASLNFNIYSGTCGSLAQVANTCYSNMEEPVTVNLTGLTVGTYYIQVWSNTAEQGTFSLRLSDPTLAVDDFSSSSFAHYPNPVKDVLNISYKAEISTVSVFNLLGQQVLNKSVHANESQIDMSSLPNGAYMVKVASGEQTKTIKVVKQ